MATGHLAAKLANNFLDTNPVPFIVFLCYYDFQQPLMPFAQSAMAIRTSIDIPLPQIEAFCHRWKVLEFSLFGSALRPDFGPKSDIDVLVRFEDLAGWSLFDVVDMTEELKAIFGREVDLVEESAIRNPFRRHTILSTKEVLYAA